MVAIRSPLTLGRGSQAGLASELLTELLQQSKRYIGWLILGILGLIAICATAKAFDCVYHNKLENAERDGNTRPPDLPLEKPICMSGSNS